MAALVMGPRCSSSAAPVPSSTPRSAPISLLNPLRLATSDGAVAAPALREVRRPRSDGEGSPAARRVFFLDVNPLCYDGATPSLRSFVRWLSLFFSQVSLRDPVVAVLDGDGGSECRRKILPSYKAHRRSTRGFRGGRYMEPHVTGVLHKCHVPVVKVNGCEADDTIATLTDQILKLGYNVVIGSPDKDFKQLLSEKVQIVMPIPNFGRWSFYTLNHYMAQYNCSPCSDLSLRSILGDVVDGVPGIQHLVPGFGRKTALKLLKRYNSLENLLNTAATRTIGKDYAQNALMRHADYLRKNYEVLSLRRDVVVQLEESWLFERDSSDDSLVVSEFVRKLDAVQSPRKTV